MLALMPISGPPANVNCAGLSCHFWLALDQMHKSTAARDACDWSLPSRHRPGLP